MARVASSEGRHRPVEAHLNLNAIARQFTRAVSPPIFGTIYVSGGQAVIAPDGTQTPTWCAFPGVSFDVQPLSGGQLRHVDALNIQGTLRSVYLNGNVEGLDRPAGKGGDVFWFDSPLLGPRYWLVTEVSEPWDSDGWVRVIVTMQDAPPIGLKP